MKLEERIYTFNRYSKETFGKRAVRISMSIGKPCPWGGCIYCNDTSFVPDTVFVPGEEGWHGKFENVKKRMERRYGSNIWLAYFQSGTSTCESPEYIKSKFKLPLLSENVKGLIISTRPDYIDEARINAILESLNENTKEVWIELGLQSTNDKSLKFINRGHTAETYFKALDEIYKTAGERIKVAPHLILGIPDENFETMKESVTQSLSHKIVKGVKFHHLQVHRGTKLEKIYSETPFKLFTAEEYIETVAELLRYVPSNVVMHRLFTTSPGEYIIGPKWGISTAEMMEKFNKIIEDKNIMQGDML